MRNMILNTDSYKVSHFKQYPKNTSLVSSYIESRGGFTPNVMFFGLQAHLLEYYTNPITRHDIDEAEDFLIPHMGVFDRAGWEHILNKHGGFMPIQIDALPEGTIVGNKVPVARVTTTDENLPWLPGYRETDLLRGIWYPSTVASLSFACRQVLYKYLLETSDNPDTAIDFALHDFGARGATSEEAACLGGMAHLVNFKGTDTVSALYGARKFYSEQMAGFSIPASEHTTTIIWKKDGEKEAYRNMIKQFSGPGKTFAFVIDSYDTWHAVDEILGTELKDLIVNNGGRIVFRPDSGDPLVFVPMLLEKMMLKFGFTLNNKKYRVLPDYVRVIQGDGVTLESLPRILEALKWHGLSTENCAFGMGGGLLQKVDRDSLKWAMKASYAEVDGEVREICKNPITDPGKKSKQGLWGVDFENGQYVAKPLAQVKKDILRPVYRNGEILVKETFADIRARAVEHGKLLMGV